MHISGIEIGFDQGEIQPSLCPAPPPPFPGGPGHSVPRAAECVCAGQAARGGGAGGADGQHQPQGHSRLRNIRNKPTGACGAGKDIFQIMHKKISRRKERRAVNSDRWINVASTRQLQYF